MFGAWAVKGAEMRITVDKDSCDSNGVCASLAPELFELADSGELLVLAPQPPAELWPAAEEAARSCPKLAIVLSGRT